MSRNLSQICTKCFTYSRHTGLACVSITVEVSVPVARSASVRTNEPRIAMSEDDPSFHAGVPVKSALTVMVHFDRGDPVDYTGHVCVSSSPRCKFKPC